jgi:hypothetical protein
MNNRERKIFEEINSFLGIETKDDVQLSYLGSEHVSGYIENKFKLSISDSPYFDPIVTSFNKTHKSNSINDVAFIVNFKREMVNRGVPCSDVENSIDKIKSIIDGIDKEFGSKHRRDAGFNSNMEDIKNVSQPIQPKDLEVISPRPGHTMKSNIKGRIPDSSN